MDASAGLTAVDLARVAVATEDNAHRYYGGPLNLSASDAARYVSEGHLKDLPLRDAWRAVADYISENPQVLLYSDAQVAEAQERRRARCGQLALAARQALTAGAPDEALALIDEAEMVDPDYRADWRTWDDIRAIIRKIAN